VWFGWDPAAEFARIWTVGGRMLPTPEETQLQLQEEQRLRQEAEQRAAEEARARQKAEARAAALAAELERLRRGG
jgi:hypothetical protein